MTIETKAQLVPEDPQRIIWKNKLKLWVSGDIDYTTLMESYPAYTLDEKIKKFFLRILPKFN
ncbi:MAG: hypothetical protein QY322_02785 [bacterium]|nr:MAG: hypothetical protein QY322_02785 [bacterium]